MPKEINISMRGMIEYLPEEIEEVLRATEKRLDKCTQQLGESLERLGDTAPHSIEHCLVELDGIRRTLYRVDSRVADCSQILASYLQHTSGEVAEQPPSGVPPQPPREPPVDEG